MASGRTLSYASQRRRESQQEEAREQTRLVAMLARWIDPGASFATALENRPRSPRAGFFQKQRGVRSGLPDIHVLYRGKSVYVELKSRVGTTSRVQRQVRLELLTAGAEWWLARSARAAMVALSRSGVGFRSLAGRRWREPRLPIWEEPVRDPSQPHPAHPEVTAQRREARRRQRARQRAREAARRAAQPSPAASGPTPVASDARQA